MPNTYIKRDADRLVKSAEDWRNEGLLQSQHHPFVPREIVESLDRYIGQGIPTGSFLRAVLANDLMDAMGKADIVNREALFYICQYIYNDVPRAAWGSHAEIESWITLHQLVRDGAYDDLGVSETPGG